MCELLGFSSRKPEDIRIQLRAFYSHSDKHPHGWGLMVGSGRKIYKEGVKATESSMLGGIIDNLSPQTDLLAHIRFATVGSVCLENCHPFSGADLTGREWTLIHNGTIYSGRKLIRSMYHQSGDTDSERLFMYLMHCVNQRQGTRPLPAEERFALIDEFVQEMSPRNKLNLMIYDGELLYVHKNMRDTLKFRSIGSGIIFATSPLDGSSWEDVPTAQLLAYSAGERIYTGTKHKGEFVPTLEYITAMDAMNI